MRERACAECGLNQIAREQLSKQPPHALGFFSLAAAVLQLPSLAWLGTWLIGALWTEYIVKPPGPFVQSGMYPSLDALSSIVMVLMLLSFLATPPAVLLWLTVLVWGVIRHRAGLRVGWRLIALPFVVAAAVAVVYLIVDSGLVLAPASWMPD